MKAVSIPYTCSPCQPVPDTVEEKIKLLTETNPETAQRGQKNIPDATSELYEGDNDLKDWTAT